MIVVVYLCNEEFDQFDVCATILSAPFFTQFLSFVHKYPTWRNPPPSAEGLNSGNTLRWDAIDINFGENVFRDAKNGQFEICVSRQHTTVR